jgi:hypothetical protein
MLVRMERAGETDNPVITYRKELLEKALQAAGKPYTIKSCDFPASVSSDARVRYGVNMQPYCDVIATSAGGRASREQRWCLCRSILVATVTASSWPASKGWPR